MQAPGSHSAGASSDILGPELMSEGTEKLLEKKKPNGIILESNFILSEIFIAEWTLSLDTAPSFAQHQQVQCQGLYHQLYLLV